jgi:hypothetical protein
VLLEELGEGGNGNVKGVGSIVLLDACNLGLLVQASGGLEMANLGLGVDVDIILKSAEGICLGVIEESALLEQERSVELATSLCIR